MAGAKRSGASGHIFLGLRCAQPPATDTEARFHLDKAGYFACKLDLLADDRAIETEVFHLAALLELWSEDLLDSKTSVRSDFAGIGGEYGLHCAENIVGSLGTAGTDAMDAWSIHPYRYPRGPEESDLIGEVTRIADRVAEAGGRGKAWITEIGWPTHRGPGGSDEAAQARYCVRTHVLLKSTGVVEKIFWYDFKDDGLNRRYNEHNFGLIHHQHFNCAPKPGIVALSVLIRMTAAAKFETLRHTGNVWSAVYRKSDGREVMVAWTDDETASVTLSGQAEAIFNMMGNSQPVSTSIELTGDPVYIVGKELKIQTNTRSSEKDQP